MSTRRRVSILFVVSLLASMLIWVTSARAANPNSLYTYDFRNASATLANQAATNSGVGMSLTGDWTSGSDGTSFTGNLTSLQSGGHAKPANGSTLSVAANEAVGASAIFMYQGLCASDSQNISQIGSFSANTTQVKLQVSKCANGNVYPECRFAGSLTASSNLAVRGSSILTTGAAYRLTCAKSPDSGTNATLTMELVRIDSANGSQTTSETFTIPQTGAMQSSAYVTAGNKYPLPSQTNNTDQSTGTIAQLSYCKAADVTAVLACLQTEVPLETAPAPTVDEVKYSFGNTSDEVVIDWRGSESAVYYGTTTDYGQQASASQSAITPVDIGGVFHEVRLNGLAVGTTYHYKIGVNGEDRTFRTAPASGDSFKVVSIGDTIAATCRTYQAAMNQLVTNQQPNFIIHGGDISIANECGNQAVHEYFQDLEALAGSAAFMPVWGNHEYGQPTANSPAGTVRDSLANYKGRVAIPNAKTVPNDTATKVSHPGCGENSGSTTNTCQGEDWGWFRSGDVLFISFPEPWYNAINDWQSKVTPLMTSAQNDPAIKFIVTYGHRPVYSSTSWTAPEGYEAAFSSLANQFGPANGGKYVLNIAQHRHNMEVFKDGMPGGVMHVVNGGGGQGLINFQSIVAGSVFRAKHLGFSTLEYDGVNRSLTYKMICGPSTTGEAYSCTPGTAVYTKTFTSDPPTPIPATLQVNISNGVSQQQAAEQHIYVATFTNAGEQASNEVTASVTLPAVLQVVDAPGAQVDGQVLTWDLSPIAPENSRQVVFTTQLVGGNNNDPVNLQLGAVSTDGSCTQAASICEAADNDTVYIPQSLIELVGNQGIEVNTLGWTGTYGGSPFVSIARSTEQAHAGEASIKVEGLAGASNLNSGFNDSNPVIVNNTVAGRQYNGSMWVKPQSVGQQIVLRLREWTPSWVLVKEQKVTFTANTTEWANVANSITAAQNGNRLAFIVYGVDVDAGEYFYADDFSLTYTP
ncbi:MAG: metallophosphoesterase family protein [Candidatus Doudnabacteria bacterium]|nr:metallophosphoesterase family protein [Candidatus Doudnabacteria bacterium]